MIQMDIKALRTLTGRRPTSWPFTSVAEDLNLGLLRTTPASGRGRTIFCIQHSEKKPAGLISIKVPLICVLFYLFIYLFF